MTLLLVVLAILIVGAVAGLVLVLLFAGSDSDVPEAADVPDPLDEHFNTAPFFSNGVPVVPGDWTAELVDAYDRYRRGEDVFAGAVHEPSPEVKQ